MAIMGRCFRGHVRGRPGTAAAMKAGLVAVAVVSVAAWPGQAVFAATFHPTHRMSHHAAHRTSSAAPTVAHRGWVKYYIVQPPIGGHKEFLYEIAAKTLGNGNLYREIFNLNKGRLQPDGGRLENPTAIDPGWVLELPANASGPGVHHGPLPVGKTPTQPPPRRPARHAPGGGHASGPQSQAMAPRSALPAAAILLVLLMLGGLTAAVSRRAVSRRRRACTHDPSGPPASGRGRPAHHARVQDSPPPPPKAVRKPRSAKVKVQPELSPPLPVTRLEVMSPVSQDGPQDTRITAAEAPPQDTATGDDDMADFDWPDYLMTGDIPPR